MPLPIRESFWVKVARSLAAVKTLPLLAENDRGRL